MGKSKCWIMLLGFSVLLLGGCAGPNYFPLKNEAVLKAKTNAAQKAVVLPFVVDLQYESAAIYNNYYLAREKSEQAEKFVVNALKEELRQYGFEVTDYVPIKAFDKSNVDDDKKLTIISELMDEYSSAVYDIRKNLNEEKGRDFDYSIGIRADELREEFSPKPDIFVRIFVSGYVMNLTALDNTGWNTTAAILSLGMTKLFPVSDDVISIEIALIDAHTGQIFWVDTDWETAHSLLVEQHVHDSVKKVLEKLKDVRKGAV